MAPPTASSSASAAPAALVLHGRYRVLHKLGDALYGSVWLCEDARANSKAAALVAVKQVALRKARQTLTRNRNMDNPWDERRIATALTRLGGHENILQFRHEFVEGGSWFVVMELCEGGDLLGLLQETNDVRVEEQQAMALFTQIACGVHFLHANGIAHRDLSLENVLIQDGVCKISDFGLSTEVTRICDEKVGKAYYMAPEVVAEREYDPAAADMWSLGIMLFIMLTGSPLMPSASVHDKSFQAMQEFGIAKIVKSWELESEVSPRAVELLTGLLQVNPAKRFTIEDLLQHLTLRKLPVQ